jgi:hypothetical protein
MNSWHIGLSAHWCWRGVDWLGRSWFYLLGSPVHGCYSRAYLVPGWVPFTLSEVSYLGHTNINFSLFRKFRSFLTDGRSLAGIISAMDMSDLRVRKFGWSQISFSDRWRLDIQTALIVMGTIAVVYTTIGGLESRHIHLTPSNGWYWLAD